VHQHFVGGRHASPVDVLIDTVGLAAGLLVSRLATRNVPPVRDAADPAR